MLATIHPGGKPPRALNTSAHLAGQREGRGQAPLSWRCWFSLSFILVLGAAGLAPAQIPQGDLAIELDPVAMGLTAPISVKGAGDGSGRLFIVDQSGTIRIVDGGVLLPTPFLDLTSLLPSLNAAYDERGLLGLAFHPDYAHNGRFFVRYSTPRDGDPSEPCNQPGFIQGCHSEVLAEYHVSGDPNVADPNSGIILFTVDEPQFNHNAGEVDFGPDGYLYFSLGDGGGANDGLADDPPSHGPIGNGQNIETVLGSLLRIDVDSPPDPGLAYAIPPDNPFVGGPGADEIYAYGFRNPFKFSFDDGVGGDGSLWLADVGQDSYEEVDDVVLGGDYGWVIREGFHCFDPFNPGTPPADCPDTGPSGEPLLDPLVDYYHLDGGIAVVGGYVYRGSQLRSLYGTYVFGDFAASFSSPSGRLYYLIEPNPGTFEIRQFIIGDDNRPYGLYLHGFGEDEAGEIYVCGSLALGPSGNSGVVERLRFLGSVPVAVADLQAAEQFDGIYLTWDISDVHDIQALRITRSDNGDDAQVVAQWSGEDVPVQGGWIDHDAPAGQTHLYQLIIQANGYEITSNLAEIAGSTAPQARSRLLSNDPNPFNPTTQIHFAMAAAGDASLQIIDATGRLVRTYRLAGIAAGEHSLAWDGRDESNRAVASGLYVVHLKTDRGEDTGRMMLVR